ncbi:MAG: ABC transporter permease subunit [Verrucomicrobia bacterium]|nr:ABC transporter permease subunit [Verrucomicrobiota bacterium]
MTRLRPPPTFLSPRVLLFCLVISLIMLWRDGGTLGEACALIILLLPLEPENFSAMRVLLGRAVASFFLISFALGIGLSCALALAMLVSRLGERISRFMGWFGRMLAGVPPMAWVLGAIYWIIQVRGLPVETLFPYQPPLESDTLALVVGRSLWAWLVPSLVLAIPVSGAAFFSLTQKLSNLLRDPAVDHLKARGLMQAQILYRHLVPLLRVHLARLARPLAVLLLAFDIPVEELLGFDGWGRYAAGQLLSPASSSHALPAIFWTGGLILAGILGWLSSLDRKGLPEESLQDSDSARVRNLFSAACGAMLMLLLMLPLRWMVPEAVRGGFENAHDAWAVEFLRALVVSIMALAFMVSSSFLMSLLRSRIFGRGWAAALAVTPLLVALIFWQKEIGYRWLSVALAAAIPGIAAFREAFREADDSDYIEVSRTLGQNQLGIWVHHVLPGALPSLPGLALRNAATIMMMFCLLDFYSASAAGTWGEQLRRHADRVLDDPIPALAPALMLALWSLSFRLLSRASGQEQSPPRNTPFDR